MFQLCGFIPVDMEANGSGEPNQYNRASFKNLLKQVKRAFDEGFDILILPEGQLNPHPARGLLPVFTGAHKLSRVSHRPVNLFALYGGHAAWPVDRALPRVTTRHLSVRGYGAARQYGSDEEFVATFQHVVGQFGATGTDTTDLDQWLDGSAWQQQQQYDNTQQAVAVDDESDKETTLTDADNDMEQAIADALQKEQQSGVNANPFPSGAVAGLP